MTSHIQRLRQNCMTFRSCVYKMADNECMGEISGGIEIKEFSCKNSFDMMRVESHRNGISEGCKCGEESCLCVVATCEKFNQRLMMNGMNNYQGSNDDACCNVSSLGLQDLEREDGSVSPMDCNSYSNKRRTLRFDSSESSDSGVAALSNTESSQSSGTSDITEPCSPPSPVSPRSCLHLQSDGDHLNGYDTTSPPSCQGSYDSGLEEATASQSPPTPGQSSDDHSLGKEESPCHRQEEDELYPDDQNDSYPPCLHKDIVSSELLPSCADSDGFQEGVCCDIATDSLDCCDRFLQPSESTVGHWSTGTVASHEDDVARRGSVKATSWTHSNQQSLWGRRSPVSTSSATVQDQRSVSLNKSKVTPECIETRSVKQLGCLASEGDPLLMCRWTNCYQSLPGGGDMIDHIRNCHVDAQVNAESFVCLWEGCKVYSKASCSLSWLERHVLTHSGNKPFKCIVDGCGQRFTSQNGLERHVNSHFNQPQPHNGNLHKRKDETPSKIMKKKRMRYRRTCWTARTEDFFDAGIMECIRHRLVMLSNHTRLDVEGSSSSVTFHSTVIARQIEGSGKVRVLLHWVPENVIPDEWVCESQVTSHLKQIIPLSRLPRDTMASLESVSLPVSRPYRKNRRK